MKFDTYRRDAGRDSEQWANTDRGWLFESYSGVDSIGAPVEGEKAVGNYLDYGPVREGEVNPEGWVHAVYHGRIIDWNRPVEFWQPGLHKSRYCETVEQAQAWLVEMHNGQKSLL